MNTTTTVKYNSKGKINWEVRYQLNPTRFLVMHNNLTMNYFVGKFSPLTTNYKYVTLSFLREATARGSLELLHLVVLLIE